MRRIKGSEPTNLIQRSSQDSITVVLIDDHEIVRQGLRSMLGREPDLLIVGEAANRAEALVVVANTQPSIVVLDLRLSASSDTEGLSLCEELTSIHPEVAVLVLTTFLSPALVVDSRRAGARGYLIKDVDTRELVAGIRAVANGGTAFDPRATDAAVQARDLAARRDRLTTRETQVLASLAHGNSDRTIARELEISDGTVRCHVRSAMRKLGVATRPEAVYAAVKAAVV